MDHHTRDPVLADKWLALNRNGIGAMQPLRDG
jgi:hypothetical protein